ncbi:hypothetical protein MJ579_29015 [Klebsiella pneumoniae]|nr:hypothetical protein MJ579_29015 [Klebsiella pneumoniae]
MGTKRVTTYELEWQPAFLFVARPKQARMIITTIQTVINEISTISVGVAGERTKQDNAKGDR